MNYISANNGVARLVSNGVQVASFPACLNDSIPTVDEALLICGMIDYMEFDVEYINTRKAHIRDTNGNLHIVSSLSVALVAGIDCIKGFSFSARNDQIDFIINSAFIRA